MSQFTIQTHHGYDLSYVILQRLSERFSKEIPAKENLRGPAYLLTAKMLTPSERAWLERQEHVTSLDCVLVHYNGQDSEDEKQLQANDLYWCGYVQEGYAIVMLPDIFDFLAERVYK
jgi:hypothetical protein